MAHLLPNEPYCAHHDRDDRVLGVASVSRTDMRAEFNAASIIGYRGDGEMWHWRAGFCGGRRCALLGLLPDYVGGRRTEPRPAAQVAKEGRPTQKQGFPN